MATGILGKYASVLVDEFNFDAYTSEIRAEFTVGSEEDTTLNSDAAEAEPILTNLKLFQNGYFDGTAADEYERELNDRRGVDGVVISALFGTNSAACPAYHITDGFGQGMEFAVPVAGLMTLNGMWANTVQPYRGIRIANVTISSTGNQSSVDLTSAGSNGGLLVVHVTAITGSATNASVKLQSSATEGGAYADEATVTFSAVGGFTAVASGTVNRWVRLNTASLGGATDFTLQAFAVVTGVTSG